MKITAIKAQVKNPERVSIYVDEKYAFSLNHAQLLEQKLRTGLEITQARLDDLKHTSEQGKAYERALNYVMIRPRSIREMQQYARRKDWLPEDAAAIINKLLARNYLNDHNFARAWVESRKLTKNYSLRKLRLELKQKGVADDVVNEVLEQVGYNEQSALKALVAKKQKLARYKNDPQKLMRYLAGQGFSYDDIKTALGY
jgi:regulatory protein